MNTTYNGNYAIDRTLIADDGKVRLGGQGPVFRFAAPADLDKGLGRQPVFIADAGKVRLGGQGPLFR